MTNQSEAPKGPYVVWSSWGVEGWSYKDADSFREAMDVRDEELKLAASVVVVTKVVVYKLEEL